MPTEADETTPLFSQGGNYDTTHLEVGHADNDDDPRRDYNLGAHRIVEHGPPADKWNLSYWIMIVQGTAMLLPWNAFITAKDFFQMRLEGSPYEHNFLNYFSAAYMGMNLLVVGSSILIQKQAPGTTHVIGSLLLNAGVFLSILISIQMERDVDPTVYFYFALTMLSLSAISTSFLQNGMFGLAAKFTGRHVQGVMLGQGVAGVGVAISQIVSQILSPPKGKSYQDDLVVSMGEGGGRHRHRTEGLEHSAFLFFSVALSFTLFSVMAQALLTRLPIYQYYTEEQLLRPIEFLAPPSPSGSTDNLSALVPENARRNSTSSNATAATTATVTPAMVAESNRRQAEETALFEEAERINHVRSTSLGAIALADDESASQLMRDIYPKKRPHPLVILYISIALIYGLTLCVFPSLTGLVVSTNTDPNRWRISGDLFVPIHFLMYNLGDWSGKVLPSFAWLAPNLQHPTRQQQMNYLAVGLARILLIPIFLTANLPVLPEKRLLPLLIHSDGAWFFLVYFLALTNGYFSSCVMMIGPASVLGGENKAQAGVKLGFWLTAGLAVGSVVSFGVRELMCLRGGCEI
ncbi:hypothetical protein BGW38_008508 [Lunasporangiospora selenospora]|uniref:Nucleoside transporter n=1 Tax=Lunasporangiospora selenospora TaxID=979761 RepID=A0A9P6KG98_9FUNG|nr:hypothetical protein BGW38_008508 [Lunasporangiospora selenospora]